MGKKPKKEDEMSEEYRKKRDRNNQAVKRSRVKSKQKTEETIARVDQLKSKNKKLEGKIEALNKQLAFLKSLFMEQAVAKKDNIDIEKLKKILADIDTDDEDEEAEKA